MTDVFLPGLNGHALAAVLTADQPGMSVLFVSGAFDHEHFPAVPQRALLRKPFRLVELRAAVDALLSDKPHADR